MYSGALYRGCFLYEKNKKIILKKEIIKFMKEIDVRGLSCPEPVLLTMDAMQDHPGKLIRVLGDEAHTRKNIEKMLEYENKSGQTTVRPDGCFEIVFQA